MIRTYNKYDIVVTRVSNVYILISRLYHTQIGEIAPKNIVNNDLFLPIISLDSKYKAGTVSTPGIADIVLTDISLVPNMEIQKCSNELCKGR